MAFLVGVDGHRFPLRRGHSYIVGRGMESDVAVEDGACSRQHAKISISKKSDSVSLEDLGSRNGTYLNGELVTQRVPVTNGGRLQLGASVFLFQLVDETEEIDLAETGTLTYCSDGYRAEMAGGDLSRCGAFALFRGLFNAKRDVTVHVAVPGEHSVIEVREGELVFADCAGLEGFNAVVKLARQSTGIFWLVENAEPCDRNVQEPTARLIAELQRCLGPDIVRL